MSIKDANFKVSRSNCILDTSKIKKTWIKSSFGKRKY